MLTTSFVWIPFTWCVCLVKNCSQSDDFSLQVSVEVSLSRCSPLQMLSWVCLSPGSCRFAQRWFFIFFPAHVLLMVMSFPLGVLGCCKSSLKWSNVIYCCFINPFCLFSTPCLGLGPSCLPVFFTEGFFNSPQGINDSFSSPFSQLLPMCVSKHRQHPHVNKTLSNSFLSSPGELLEPHRTWSSPLIPLFGPCCCSGPVVGAAVKNAAP